MIFSVETMANPPFLDTSSATKNTRAAVLFSLSSIAMILLNKKAVISFPHVAILLLFQNITTIVILKLSVDLRPFCLQSALKWIPCVFLFCVNLFSSLQSLVYISVPTFTVLRNTQPIMAVAIDFVLRGQRTKTESIGYLFEILAGALLYCSHDIDFDLRGYSWAMLHILSMTVYSIMVKMRCGDLALSAQDMSF